MESKRHRCHAGIWQWQKNSEVFHSHPKLPHYVAAGT
ncbi:hypothetical protein A2U01_0097262, partial [Trifolium medium]|nr:hypothetical protein [Trifolium medium]